MGCVQHYVIYIIPRRWGHSCKSHLKSRLEPGVIGHPHLQSKHSEGDGRRIWRFKASLDYTLSSRTAWTT